MLLPTIALLIAFLCGSTPTAKIMGRLKGIDITRHGSGNIGATNAFRVLGKHWGIACLVIDALKGFLPAMAFGAGAWAGERFRWQAIDLRTWTLIVGLAAVAGHSFSPWVGFKGGKGVATSLGVYLAVAPIPLLICLGLGAALIAATGYVSVGSIVGAALLPILLIFIPPGGQRSWPVIAMTAALGGIIIYKHRANIGRLMNGTENRIFGRRTAESGTGKS
jgi:glycerol-3-phosphate acyltransferase PlsY